MNINLWRKEDWSRFRLCCVVVWGHGYSKRNSRASIRKQMNQKVQAVLKLKVEQFTEIAAQEEAIDLATIESAKAIRKLQDNGVTMDEAADSTGISVNRLRAIVKRAEELERLEDDDDSVEQINADHSSDNS